MDFIGFVSCWNESSLLKLNSFSTPHLLKWDCFAPKGVPYGRRDESRQPSPPPEAKLRGDREQIPAFCGRWDEQKPSVRPSRRQPFGFLADVGNIHWLSHGAHYASCNDRSAVLLQCGHCRHTSSLSHLFLLLRLQRAVEVNFTMYLSHNFPSIPPQLRHTVW